MKWKRLAIIGILSTPLLLLLAVSITGSIYNRRVANAIAAYHAAGEPIEPQDFPQPSSDSLAAGKTLLDLATITFTPEDYTRTNPREGIATLYIITSEERAAARAELNAHFPDESALASALAVSNPAWVNPPAQSFVSMRLEHLPKLRSIASALADDAQLRLLDGDTPENNAHVVLRIQQLQKLASLVGNDGPLPSLLNSKAIDALALDIAQTGPAALTPAQARALIPNLLDDASRHDRTRRAMLIERASILEAINSTVARTKPALRPFLRFAWAREIPWLLQLQDTVAAGMLDQSQPERAALQRRFDTTLSSKTTYLARILQPNDRFMVSFAHSRANRRITACILALRAYRTEHAGNLPATLDELVPTFLPAVPLDPFSPTGEPLKYNADTRIIYTVNTNGIDDGGNLIDPKYPTSSQSQTAPDHGYRLDPLPKLPRPAEEEPG